MARNILLVLLAGAAAFAVIKHDWLLSLVGHGANQTEATADASTAPANGADNANAAAPAPAARAAAPASTGANGATALATPAPMVHKAPAGYLFVLRHVSKETDSGIVGVEPGTQLAVLSRGSATTKVSDGTNQFDIKNEDLTDDADAAQAALRASAQSQAALEAWMQQRNADIRKANQVAAAQMAKQQQLDAQRAAARARSAAANPPPASNGNTGTSLDRGAYDQHRSVPYWYDAWGRRYYVDSYGHWVYY